MTGHPSYYQDPTYTCKLVAYLLHVFTMDFFFFFFFLVISETKYETIMKLPNSTQQLNNCKYLWRINKPPIFIYEYVKATPFNTVTI